MKLRSWLSTVFFLIAISTAALPQTAAPKEQSDKSPKDMHGLIIYGKGFSFSTSEPEGWDADTDKAARDYSVNAVFFPRAKESRSAHVNIRIRVNRKTTEDPAEDMATDVAEYKAKYPKVRFEDLNLSHDKYKTSAKAFIEPDAYYEYVVYLNPGANTHISFSFAMSKEKKAATKEEMEAFEHVLKSFTFLTEKVVHLSK